MNQNPFTAVFDAQHSAIEQSQALTLDAIEVQQQSFTAFADALSASESLVAQNAEFTKDAVHTSFETLEATLPEDAADFEELHALIDDGVDAATETQLQSLEALSNAVDESSAAYDEIAESYVEYAQAQAQTQTEA